MEILLWSMLWIMFALILFVPFVIVLSGVLVFINSIVNMFKSKT
jgi:hypothetical protein